MNLHAQDPRERFALLQRVETCGRAIAADGPDTLAIETGPFDVFVDTRHRESWKSFAVPRDDARPARDDVAALQEAFRRHHRVPAVILMPALCPAVPDALRDGGFTRDRREALMVRDAAALPHVESIDDLELLDVDPGSEIAVRSFDRVLRAAFGDPPGDADLDGYRARIDRGARFVSARVDADVVAVGSASPVRDGMAWIGGIGTLPVIRRRGVASAVTARLCELAIAAGAELLALTAAGPEAGQVYARLGFAAVAEYEHFRAPERAR